MTGAAVPAAIAAEKGVEPIVKELKELLTGDIVTFEGELFREVTAKFEGGKKQTKLVPVKYTARINAMSILLGIGGAGLGAMFVGFALWWSQLRVGRLTNKEQVALKNEISEGSKFLGLSGAMFQTADAIAVLRRGDELTPGLFNAMSQLILTRGIDPLGTVNLKTLLLLMKSLETRVKQIRRALRLGVTLREREGFSLGPKDVTISLIG